MFTRRHKFVRFMLKVLLTKKERKILRDGMTVAYEDNPLFDNPAVDNMWRVTRL